jgi:hypothetical protein
VFLICIYRELKREGIITYHELVSEAECEVDRNRKKKLELVLSGFPEKYRNVANSFDQNINNDDNQISHFLDADGKWIRAEAITTREMQWILKKAMDKITSQDFNHKTGIDNYDPNNIKRFRQSCKNPKLRNIYFRMINNDFFTHERMFKYKMVESPMCPRCGSIENMKHQIWECFEAQNIWNLYNNFIMTTRAPNTHLIRNYESIFQIDNVDCINIIRIKIVQEMIQIVRPTKWQKTDLVDLIQNLKNIEKYNAKLNYVEDKIKLKWNITNTYLETE